MMATKLNSLSWRTLAALLAISLSCSNGNSSIAAGVRIFDEIKSSPMQQAETAVSESLKGAKNASAAVTALSASGRLKSNEVGAVDDCLVTVSDAVQELQRSLKAMKRDLNSQISNVQTWVSAALTDENTCMDGFADGYTDGEARRIIRAEIVKVARLISNALSIINGLASSP